MKSLIFNFTRLHLGCGKRNIPGFLNIDIEYHPHVHLVQDILDLSNLPSNHFELIYSSHVFEYFTDLELIQILSQCRRILKSQGVLRIAVPDIDQLIKVYLNNNEPLVLKGPILGIWEIKDDQKKVLKKIQHKNLFNKKSLTKILISSGFINVDEWKWEETDHSEYDDHSQAYFPHMQKQEGTLISLNLQCSKL